MQVACPTCRLHLEVTPGSKQIWATPV
ncbi:MAG TPA: hypothetical protein DCP67_05500 [Planctomycetaceae bacterium]|nr:hypothetical protein [Planctomycetaceae bacterium]HCP83757.1 hypothetical protein [Planctomycetaceae bacterium]